MISILLHFLFCDSDPWKLLLGPKTYSLCGFPIIIENVSWAQVTFQVGRNRAHGNSPYDFWISELEIFVAGGGCPLPARHH